MRKVTAEDVAELAGVSRWTVNRAFKPHAPISKKNLEKVLTAAKSLGYAPNLIASGLASNKTGLVALFVNDFLNPHKLPLINQITDAIQNDGRAAIITNINKSEKPSNALVSANQRRVDATVLIGTGFDEVLVSTTLNPELIDNLILFARESNHPNTTSICCDDKRAIQEILTFMIARGYRKPLFLTGPFDPLSHMTRRDTFSEECQLKGLSHHIMNIGSYDRERSLNAVYGYLSDKPKSEHPDMIICENDILALGAIDAVRYKLKLRVPEDIAITGFDDIDISASPAYDITTYQQPIDKMVSCLMDTLNSPDLTKHKSLFAGKMIPRSST